MTQERPSHGTDGPEPIEGSLGAAAPDDVVRPRSASTAEPPAEQKLPFALQDGETVINRARRHWVYLAVNLGKDILAGLLPVIAVGLLVYFTAGFDGTLGRVVIGLIVAWLAFWVIRGYFTWYKYQNDLWVVTNQRIVDSLKKHWFHHRMASADLVNVEDMSVDREGLFATMFNYGDLNCQTAGAQEKFVLSGIPKPTEVLAVVDRYRDAARRELTRANFV